MEPNDPDRPLNHISTLWALVCQAQAGSPEASSAAQQQLLQRYRGAVYRYLLAAVRDDHAADDLAQEFALRFIQGKLRGADPAQGRFRDYLKGVLSHLVADHYRRRPPPAPLPADGPEPAAPPSPRATAAPSSPAGGRSCWPGPGRPWTASSAGPASRSTPCWRSDATTPSCARPRWRSASPPDWASRSPPRG
jgi:hypothetical protein